VIIGVKFMRLPIAMASLLLGSTLLAGWQSPIEAKLLAQLKQLSSASVGFEPPSIADSLEAVRGFKSRRTRGAG